MDKGIVTTFSGHHLNVLCPDPALIKIVDIATGLSRACRYAGQCNFFYSVAQHCINGSHFCSSSQKLPFLLHDAAEAYICDVVKNVKDCLSEYKAIENVLQEAIYLRFGVQRVDWGEIKRIDNAIMATEANVLIKNTEGWDLPEKPLKVNIAFEDMDAVKDNYVNLFYGWGGCTIL